MASATKRAKTLSTHLARQSPLAKTAQEDDIVPTKAPLPLTKATLKVPGAARPATARPLPPGGEPPGDKAAKETALPPEEVPPPIVPDRPSSQPAPSPDASRTTPGTGRQPKAIRLSKEEADRGRALSREQEAELVGSGAYKVALGPQNAWGKGGQMEPEKWRRWKTMVEKNRFGAHYDWVCEPIAYEYWERDPGQLAFDKNVAEHLRGWRDPADASGVPQARAAFPDRAVRLREGSSMKQVICGDGPFTDWRETQACGCDACHPFDAKPAGQLSYPTLLARERRHGGAPGAGAAGLSKSTSCPMLADSVGPAIRGERQDTSEEERVFRQQLGLKCRLPTSRTDSALAKFVHSDSLGGTGRAKGTRFRSRTRMLPHRSMSVDNLPAAGDYFADHLPFVLTCIGSKGRQPWQSGPGQPPRRTAMHMAMEPKDSDPAPPPELVLQRKADGTYKYMTSEAAEKSICEQNQAVLRYADPKVSRARSFSPPRSGIHAGLSARHLSRIRRGMDRSPRRHRENPMNNRSGNMAMIMDSEASSALWKREAAERRRHDARFRELCKATAKHRRSLRRAARGLCDSRTSSCGVRANLVWPM